MQKFKTATIINSIDPIFLASCAKEDLFIVVLKNTPLEFFAKNNFSPNKIIAIELKNEKYQDILSFEEILAKTDLTKKLKEAEIKYFIIPHKNLEEINNWARKNQIKLIGSHLSFQKKLENKISFDQILKKYKINSPPTVSINDLKKASKNKKYVIQEAESYGLFGTKFFKSGKKLYNFISQNPKIAKNSLIRQYLPGIPLGVTILINRKGRYGFSALRRQCFQYQAGFPKNFLGIQWLSATYFNQETTEKINSILNDLAKALAKIGFYGIANIDLLISPKGLPYILECNPRLSSATQHIFSVKNITSLAQPWDFFLNTFYDKEDSTSKIAKMPKSKFQGCLLDVDIKEKTKIKKLLPIGIYSLDNKKISFVSNNFSQLKQNKNYFFLFHEIPAKNITLSDFTLCTIISSLPLFNRDTGKINQKGKRLFNYFKKQFLN